MQDEDVRLLHKIAGRAFTLAGILNVPSYFPENNQPLAGDDEHRLLHKISASLNNVTKVSTSGGITSQNASQQVINRSDLIALTGGASDALDGVATVSLVNDLEALGSPDYGPILHIHYESGTDVADIYYRFTKSMDSEQSPYTVRPDDYSSQSTKYVWKLAGGPYMNGVPLINDASDVTLWYQLLAASGGGSTQVGTAATTIA